MADGINFTNEPKGLGPKEPRKRRGKASKEDAPNVATPASTASVAPSSDAKAAKAPAVGKAAAPAAPPPLAATVPAPGEPPLAQPGENQPPARPQTASEFFSQWFQTVPWFIGVPLIPVGAIIYGVKTLRSSAAVDGGTKRIAIWVLASGSAAILAFAGLIAFFALQPGESKSVDDITIGDCFLPNGIDGPAGETSEVGGLRVIDCAEPHYGQVYFQGTATGSSGFFPGEFQVQQEVEAVCFAQYEAKLSQIGYFKAPYISYLYPTRQLWESGDLGFTCMATADTAADIYTGSVLVN